MYNECDGPVRERRPAGRHTPETGDALCYYAGDTHPGYDGPGTSTPPDTMTGCQDNLFQNGDLDFDGTPYWKEWPTGLTPTIYPSSFVEPFPTSNGQQYSQFFFQTDIALSESTCGGNTLRRRRHLEPAAPCRRRGRAGSTRTGARSSRHGACALEFGNVSAGSA